MKFMCAQVAVFSRRHHEVAQQAFCNLQGVERGRACYAPAFLNSLGMMTCVLSSTAAITCLYRLP
jgi:hypothetical protein